MSGASPQKKNKVVLGASPSDALTASDRAAYVQRSLVKLEYLAEADADDNDKVASALGDFCFEWGLNLLRIGTVNPNEGGLGGIDSRDDYAGAMMEKFRKIDFRPVWAAFENAIAKNKHAPAWVGQYHSNPDPPAESPSDLDVPPQPGDGHTLGKDGAQYYYGFIRDDLTRKRFLKLRGDVLQDPTKYAQRSNFVARLSKEKIGFQFTQSGLKAADMPSWVKLTSQQFDPQPNIWNGIQFAEHHDERSWGFFADVNHSADGYLKAAGGIATRGARPNVDYWALNVFGPMVPFTVVDQFIHKPGDFGAAVWVRMVGSDWLFGFGHMCEISKTVWEGRGHKVVFAPGTYLGSCRTWIGKTDNPHCHISVISPPLGNCLVFAPYWQPLLTNVWDFFPLTPKPKDVGEAVARWDEVVAAFKQTLKEAQEATEGAKKSVLPPEGDPGQV
jgi:hypothetical protein